MADQRSRLERLEILTGETDVGSGLNLDEENRPTVLEVEVRGRLVVEGTAFGRVEMEEISGRVVGAEVVECDDSMVERRAVCSASSASSVSES